MIQSAESIGGLARMAGMILFGLFLICWTCRKSEAPARMLFRWLLSLGVLAFFITVMPLAAQGRGIHPLAGLYLAGLCGLVLALTWLEPLGTLAGRLFVSLFDGATAPPEPVPIYSVARARQKQGKYADAVREIRKQLARFPADVEGQCLMAQILAENLKDLPAAQCAIEHFCAQPGHAPKNIVFALYSMADWHLSIGRDLEAARQCLERLIELLPDSEHALGAAQRIAHLAAPKPQLVPKRFVVKEGALGLGLAPRNPPSTEAPDHGGNRAAEIVEHLLQHPLDCDAREQLAISYADHFGRLDLATDQLMQMIELPNQPSRNVVRSLNLLADLQVRCGADLLTVQETLQRIIDRDPQAVAARLARNRISLLKLEFKGKEKSQAVKLGSYEQNIGLKRSSSNQL